MDIIEHDGGPASPKRAVRRRAWTEAVKTDFIDRLAGTCNVRHAARSVGRDTSGAYQLKRRDVAFAAAWAVALQEGYQRLEAELLATALGADDTALAGDTPGRTGPGPIDRDLAIKLLTRRAAADPRRTTAGRQYKRVPIEEVERALLRQLDAIEKRSQRRV